MALSAKSLRLLSFVHVALGVLAIIGGLAAMLVTNYYNGLYGMGIWLGSWVILTGSVGLASSLMPRNFCRIGGFLGFCLVAVVLLSVCCIVIGTVAVRHFEFESSVTRDYYKGKGTFGNEHHEDFYKSEEYFEERHENGRIGLAVYGSLLVISLCDVLLCCASIYVCRDLTRSEQVTLASSNSRHSSLSRYSQRNIATLPIAELGYSHQNWAEVVFQGAIPQPLQPIQGHFLQHPDFQFFAPYKLPNYAELYPEGIVNPGNTPASEDTRLQIVPNEPPPAYTPTENQELCQLPGSSLGASLNSHPALPTEGSASGQGSTTNISARTLTPENTIVSEATRVSQLSSREHPQFSETPSENLVSCTPVLTLHAENSTFSSLPVTSSVADTSEIVRRSSSFSSVSPEVSLTSLPNSVQLTLDMDHIASSESQNNTAHRETVTTPVETNGDTFTVITTL